MHSGRFRHRHVQQQSSRSHPLTEIGLNHNRLAQKKNPERESPPFSLNFESSESPAVHSSMSQVRMRGGGADDQRGDTAAIYLMPYPDRGLTSAP